MPGMLLTYENTVTKIKSNNDNYKEGSLYYFGVRFGAKDILIFERRNERICRRRILDDM